MPQTLPSTDLSFPPRAIASFGTSFFPTDTSHLLALIETLNAAVPALPYVFSWSSGNLDAEVVNAVAASDGLGMIAE